MAGKTPNTRITECEVDSMFTDCWSPRAFLFEPLDEYHVIAAIAVGRKDEAAEDLPEDLRAMESPNTRKPPSEVATDNFPIKRSA